MSTTYLTGMRASAIRSSCGEIYYRLEEQTYESNVFPQRPEWSDIAFGNHEQVMRRIFSAASAFDGGCFADPGRKLTASAYVSRWRRILAEPLPLRWARVKLVLGISLYDIPSKKEAFVKGVLAEHGVTLAWAQVTEFGRDSLQLELDLDDPIQIRALAALVSAREEDVSAWRVLQNAVGNVTRDNDLRTPVPTLLRSVDLGSRFVWGLPGTKATDDGGPVRMYIKDGLVQDLTGWKYQINGRFINTEVPTIEAVCPGAAEGAINAFRRMVATPQMAPLNARLKVRMPVGQPRWVTPAVRAYNTLAEVFAPDPDGALVLSVGQLVETLVSDRLDSCFEPGQAMQIDSAQWAQGFTPAEDPSGVVSNHNGDQLAA